MNYDVFDEVRDAAPCVVPPTELQRARQRRLLAVAIADVTASSTSPGPDDAVRHLEPAPAHLHRKGRMLVAGVAAAALVGTGIAVATTTGRRPAPTVGATRPSSRAPGVLYRLASASIDDPALVGRYVILSETDTETGYTGTSERTTVIDTETGASTTYQEPYAGTDAPSVLTEPPDPSWTAAWFAALPTDPVALRAELLAIAEQQQAKADQETNRAFASEAGLSDDDLVYEEANDLLWNPLCQPTLRAALYRVLATTSGFTVDPNATDPSGRPAIALVRSANGETDTTYEDPSTGAVLAQVWSNGDSGTIAAVYQSATASNTMPPDPYAN